MVHPGKKDLLSEPFLRLACVTSFILGGLSNVYATGLSGLWGLEPPDAGIHRVYVLRR